MVGHRDCASNGGSMVAPNVAAATSLHTVARHLETAATRLDQAVEAEGSYRVRPWFMRSKVHEQVVQAQGELRRAHAATPTGDGGFAIARGAAATLDASLNPRRLGAYPADYRQRDMSGSAAIARGWAAVAREGARLLEDPSTTAATTRDAALDLARGVSRDPNRDDLIRLAAIDELPASLRPDIPVRVATEAVYASLDERTSGALHGTAQMLGSWEQRARLLERPGFDRAAAVDELARALDLADPRDALRVVAALDQLPGHVRPDLPHVGSDWNWTEVTGPRYPKQWTKAVESLRPRLDDLRVSASMGAAPPETLDEVARVVGTATTDVSLGSLRRLRDLPGFPPSLVAASGEPTQFDLVRTRVWLDAQRLAAQPGASRDGMVGELQHALDAFQPMSHRAGGAGSGAELADRLEGAVGPRGDVRPPATGREALIRIAAIDSLQASLRPHLPELVGIGNRIDAAAHQSLQATDHRRDLLRLQAWASQFPRTAPVGADAVGASDEASRSAVRRFLDPAGGEAGAPHLDRAAQADVVMQVLGAASEFSPRLHHGALVATERYLASAAVADAQVRGLVDRTLEMVRRNLRYTEGMGNPGYTYHPDYAELGRIAGSVRLLRAFEALDATTATTAAKATADAATLTW